jgi:hypothetical protein
MMWFIRKWFWNILALIKAAGNKPLNIPLPTAGPAIEPVPLSQAVNGLPIQRVLAARPEDVPADEVSRLHTMAYKVQVWLYGVFPAMQPGLPPINNNPKLAFHRAYSRLHRKLLPEPQMPAEFLGSPDLGALATRGPYACYTTAVGDGSFEWRLAELDNYEHHEGLRKLGAVVRFEVDPLRRALKATRISCAAYGEVTPEQARWEAAKKLALAAITNHISLVRHFNWVHLAGGAMLAIATRNKLPPNHALMRLMWPYIYGTQQSNDIVTRGQMLPGGDFESVYSLSFKGMCQLFDDTWAEFDIVHNDPEADAARRGVIGQGFDTPTENNLATLFGVMHEHARNYLRLYYASDEALRADEAVLAWLDELNRFLPRGVGVSRETADLATLARFIARCIYLVSAQHEILGAYLWNYQVWTHREPVRIYTSGQREPLDVYQRLVNANFNLNVKRRTLIYDFTYLALDTEGAAEMKRFAWNLTLLQQKMQRQPWTAWALYPEVLKVNINA